MFVADFDPNFISLGPISIKWYSLAYIFGIIVGFCYLAFLEKKYTLKEQGYIEFDLEGLVNK